MNTDENREEYPEGFIWSCCERRGGEDACRIGKHIAEDIPKRVCSPAPSAQSPPNVRRCLPSSSNSWTMTCLGPVRNHTRRHGIARLLKQYIVNSFNAISLSIFLKPVVRLWGFFVLTSSNITWNYGVPITKMFNSMSISLDFSALQQKLLNPETRAVKFLILKNPSGCSKGKKVLTKTRLFASRPVIWYTTPGWFPFTAAQVQCPCPKIRCISIRDRFCTLRHQ